MIIFTKLLSAFAIFKNLSKLKEITQTSYVVLVKLLSVLKFLETQVNDTKLGVTLSKYLPTTITALQTVKDLVDKYGSVLGIEPVVESLNDKDVSALSVELKRATFDLKKHV